MNIVKVMRFYLVKMRFYLQSDSITFALEKKNITEEDDTMWRAMENICVFDDFYTTRTHCIQHYRIQKGDMLILALQNTGFTTFLENNKCNFFRFIKLTLRG